MLVKVEVAKLQALAVVFLASLWSSAVHCRVVGQMNDREDAETDNDDDASWPVLCPDDTFFDKIQEKCIVCSQCPMNKVITSPCQGLQDTQCGPFISFNHFDTSGKSSGNLIPDGLDVDVDIESKQVIDSKAKTNGAADVKDIHTPSEVNTLESEEKSLSLILVIVLIVVSVIFLMVIAITCYVRRKSAPPPTKKILCEYQAAPVPL